MLAGCSTTPAPLADEAAGAARPLLPAAEAEALSTLTQPRIGLAVPAVDGTQRAERARTLLAAPLTVDAAMELALLQHRGLHARWGELALAEAARVQAGRLPNPTLAFGRVRGGGGPVEIERSLGFDLLGLLTAPWRSELAAQQRDQAQRGAALDAVDAALDARRAWFDAVAARQLLHYQKQVQDAAEAAHELAGQMAALGNFSRLQQAREQAFQIEARALRLRAEQAEAAARERLVRALGLDEAQRQTLQLPDRLPDLPAAPQPEPAWAQAAMDRRLDLQMARADTEATAGALGLTRRTRWINVLHGKLHDARESGGPRREGVEIEFSLPLFDFGQSRVARAEALYRQSLDRTAALAQQARSEVREAYGAYRSAEAIARTLRDEALPLARTMADENLLRYNGMLIGVFELLAESRAQVRMVTTAIDALHAHWLAETELQRAVHARSPTALPNAAAAPAPAAAGGH